MGDKIRKLSTAVRLGAAVTKPSRCHFFEFNRKKQVTRSCALGAAAIALGLEFPRQLFHRFPELYRTVNWPDSVTDGKGYRADLSCIIIGLVDSEGWSRERIADWLESIGL